MPISIARITFSSLSAGGTLVSKYPGIAGSVPASSNVPTSEPVPFRKIRQRRFRGALAAQTGNQLILVAEISAIIELNIRAWRMVRAKGRDTPIRL